MSRHEDRRHACRYGQEMHNTSQWCPKCGGSGFVWPESLSAVDRYRKIECPNCVGTKADPIPWSELFKK